MNAETALLLKHLGAGESDSALVVDCPDSMSMRHIVERAHACRTSFLNNDFSVHRNLRQAIGGDGHGVSVLFGDTPRGPHDLLILYLPRERAATEMALASLQRTAGPRSGAWIVGLARAGARAARLSVAARSASPLATHSGRHAVLYHFTVAPAPSVDFDYGKWTMRYQYSFHGRLLTAVTLPGVFSYGRLDPGTRLLLESLVKPPRPVARILDFGCGAGTIGAALRIGWPRCSVDMVDRDSVALEASRRTLAANGLRPDALWPSDSFSHVPDKYDMIVSNPPFHEGIRADRSVLGVLVRQASSHLRPGGKLRIVVGRFVRHTDLFKESFGGMRTVSENGTYRVVEATRSR